MEPKIINFHNNSKKIILRIAPTSIGIKDKIKQKLAKK
jgi:hypothetical protein